VKWDCRRASRGVRVSRLGIAGIRPAAPGIRGGCDDRRSRGRAPGERSDRKRNGEGCRNDRRPFFGAVSERDDDGVSIAEDAADETVGLEAGEGVEVVESVELGHAESLPIFGSRKRQKPPRILGDSAGHRLKFTHTNPRSPTI
jgi:hypothetical protein